MSRPHSYICECHDWTCEAEVRCTAAEWKAAHLRGRIVVPEHAYRANTIFADRGTYAIVSLAWDEGEGKPTCHMCWSELTDADAQGLCLSCHWVVRGEIETGLYEITDYLAKYTRFEQWCAERGIAA